MQQGTEAAEFLAGVEARLSELLAGPAPTTLGRAAAQLCLAEGAKRARPLLLSLFARLVDAPAEAVLDAAVAVELVHSASLLHDDVVDEGELRRGRPTTRMLYGNDVAVLAGDFVLATALSLFGRHSPALAARAVEVVAAMTRAALVELEGRRRVDFPEEGWRLVASGKTGALFGLCGYSAGVLAGDEAAAASFAAVGERLGLAFQLADDLVDFAEGAGKDRFADLRGGNPNALVARAAARSAQVRGALAGLWSGAAVDEAALGRTAESVLATGAAREIAREVSAECGAARAALEPYRAHDAAGAIARWTEELAAGAGRFA